MGGEAAAVIGETWEDGCGRLTGKILTEDKRPVAQRNTQGLNK